MLQIGEFSRLSRISVRMLRHYDQVGLLKPAEQDAQTGYRRYAVSQLAEANRITVLRDWGSPSGRSGGWRMRTTGSWRAPWTIAHGSSRRASDASSADSPTCAVSGRRWRPAGRPSAAR